MRKINQIIIFAMIAMSALFLFNDKYAQAQYCNPGLVFCNNQCISSLATDNGTQNYPDGDADTNDGKKNDCGIIVCRTDYVNCSGDCRASASPGSQSGCALGQTYNSCTGCTGPAAVELSPAVAQSGFFNVTGKGILGGDLYLTTLKAIRVDGADATSLNLGNWGGGTFGLNVLGGLTVSGNLDASGGITLGGVARTSWPATSQWITNGANIYYDGAGSVSIGTAIPSSIYRLDIAGHARASGVIYGEKLGAGGVPGEELYVTNSQLGNPARVRIYDSD